MKVSRRNILAAGGSTAIITMVGSVRSSWAQLPEVPTSPDLIVHNAKVTTLQSGRPEAEAFAVGGERIVAVGGDADIMGLRAANTRVIDAGGRRVRVCRWRRHPSQGGRCLLANLQAAAALGRGSGQLVSAFIPRGQP